MAAATATLDRKRKRDHEREEGKGDKETATSSVKNGRVNFASPQAGPKAKRERVKRVDVRQDLSIQIVTGSYERVLHGFCASIPAKSLQTTSTTDIETDADEHGNITFSDTFLFAAHASSIRCLALSPPVNNSKRILATGGSDERINLYNLSTAPPAAKVKPPALSMTGISTSENSKNRSLGSLLHHDRAITRLHFVTKSKLFSAAEDNTIAISRTRDWTVLSSIKAPIPKPQGRPSGDTAGLGEVPAGVNDFAIHPSQKLMLSVSRGERCMRLWNLMTGKKAGVLSFDRELLAQVGEGKVGAGEGRRVLWDGEGEMFVVGFERGAAVFGIDSKPKAIIRTEPATKVHQMRFLPRMAEAQTEEVLVVSTEDGRILFFRCQIPPEDPDIQKLAPCACTAQLGGPAAGISNRFKDFEIIQLPMPEDQGQSMLLLVTASSDGAVRIWTVSSDEIITTSMEDHVAHGENGAEETTNGTSKGIKQLGNLIGTLETGNRITCLAAIVMDGKAGEDVAGEEEWAAFGVQDENGDEDEDDSDESE